MSINSGIRGESDDSEAAVKGLVVGAEGDEAELQSWKHALSVPPQSQAAWPQCGWGGGRERGEHQRERTGGRERAGAGATWARLWLRPEPESRISPDFIHSTSTWEAERAGEVKGLQSWSTWRALDHPSSFSLFCLPPRWLSIQPSDSGEHLWNASCLYEAGSTFSWVLTAGPFSASFVSRKTEAGGAGGLWSLVDGASNRLLCVFFPTRPGLILPSRISRLPHPITLLYLPRLLISHLCPGIISNFSDFSKNLIKLI